MDQNFRILYEKASAHRNALAVRNAGLEFELGLAQDRIMELEKQLQDVAPKEVGDALFDC